MPMTLINGVDADGVVIRIDDHMHGPQHVYPTLANGVTVTGGAAWTLGNYAEVIPNAQIGHPFGLTRIYIEHASADDTYELVLYAVTTEIGRVRFTRDVAGASTEPLIELRINTPIQPAGTQIQAKIASSSGADSAIISVAYQEH